MVLTVGLLIAGVLVFFAMILIFIAILCGSICVVHQLRKMDAGRFVRRCASSKVSYPLHNVQYFYSHILNYACILPTCADFLMARFAYHCSYKYLQYTSKYFIVGSCIEQTMPSIRKCTT